MYFSKTAHCLYLTIGTSKNYNMTKLNRPMYHRNSYILILLIFFIACGEFNRESELVDNFKSYYKSVKNKDDLKWNFTADTVYVWFEKHDTIPSFRFKGKPISKWGEWDRVMNSSSYYDSIWYNKKDHAIQGFFYESNDFYDLIGASPNKTLRTYSLNDENKISDVLYERIDSENTISDEHLDPIYEWALKNDSLEIMELYPDKQFAPSTENALRWRKLIGKYHESVKPKE